MSGLVDASVDDGDDVVAGAGQTTQSFLRHLPVTEVILKGLLWLV